MTLRRSPTKGLGMRKSIVAKVLAPALMLGLAADGLWHVGSGSGGIRRRFGRRSEAVTGLRSWCRTLRAAGTTSPRGPRLRRWRTRTWRRNVEVFNVPGAGGTVGLQRVVNESGNGKLLMQMGLGVVGAAYTNNSEATLQDTTPIAKLIEEPEAVVVPAASPYQTLDQLVQAWKADTQGTPVGGGSSPGGPDHLAPHLMAQAVGIDPKTGQLRRLRRRRRAADRPARWPDRVRGERRRRVRRSDRGRTGARAGRDRRRSGRLTSTRPTLREAGVDMEFTNWRGIVAPPGLSDADKQALAKLVDDMHNSQEWKEALEQNNFTDAYLPRRPVRHVPAAGERAGRERAPRARTDAGLSPDGRAGRHPPARPPAVRS